MVGSIENSMAASDIAGLIKKLPVMLYECYGSEGWPVLYVSDGCFELTGYTVDELISGQVTYIDLVHFDDRQAVIDKSTVAAKQRIPFNFEYRLITKSGDMKWIWGQGVMNEEGEENTFEGFLTDISTQKEMFDELRREVAEKQKESIDSLSLLSEYKKAVDSSAIVFKTDGDGLISYVNERFCRVSGYQSSEVLAKPYKILLHKDMASGAYKALWKNLKAGHIWKGIIKNKTKKGQIFFGDACIVPILNVDNKISEYVAIMHDVTEIIEQKERIRHQTTDRLTGLPNRSKLIEDLKLQANAKLAILNVDRFKEVNEYYGFDVGDQLLVSISRYLFKKTDALLACLYRLSGNEFAILCSGQRDLDDFIFQVESILLKVSKHTFYIDDDHFSIDLICGISARKDFFINAEMALNYAKANGVSLIVFDYQEGIKERIEANISWTHKLKYGIEHDGFSIYIQPILNNKSRQVKYECLLRLTDKEGVIHSPGSFLHVAKKSKLYSRLTEIVIEKSFAFFADKNSVFSINITVEDILNKETVSFLISRLSFYPGLAKRLIIEMVEQEGIENLQEVQTFFELMKRMGCQVAIDDFGTGYSNFDYLMQLDVDYIKIDGSIIKKIDQDKNARLVAEMVVQFAKQLGIETVSEFVHSKPVLQEVCRMQIDYSQGYFISQPVPLSDYPVVIDEQSPLLAPVINLSPSSK